MKSVNSLIKNIRDYPEDWETTSNIAYNSKLGVEIWIGNSFIYCKPYRVLGNDVDNISNWNIFDRIKVWRELKKIPNYLILKALNK